MTYATFPLNAATAAELLTARVEDVSLGQGGVLCAKPCQQVMLARAKSSRQQKENCTNS
jgi:hypothetical protein